LVFAFNGILSHLTGGIVPVSTKNITASHFFSPFYEYHRCHELVLSKLQPAGHLYLSLRYLSTALMLLEFYSSALHQRITLPAALNGLKTVTDSVSVRPTLIISVPSLGTHGICARLGDKRTWSFVSLFKLSTG
jgi:hypothetical protein